MISKPQGYDEAQAYTGEFVSLPAGCYVCKIKQVSQTATQNDRPQLAVLFDIAEGEYKDFYQKQFDAAKKNDPHAKWRGVYKQGMDGNSVPFFKGLMTSVEKSNPGYVFPWGHEGNEKTLVGKKFGALIGREEYMDKETGEKHMATKIFQVRSLEGLKDAKVPEDRMLSDADLNNYKQQHMPSQPQTDTEGFMNIPEGIDEELPFM